MEPYIYDFHTEGGGVGVALKVPSCLRILLFLNDRSIVHADGRGSQNVSFSVAVKKWVTHHAHPCLLLGIIIDEHFELYTHIRKNLIDENYIENYIYIENIDKIERVSITSDTENLDESLTLSKVEYCDVNFRGFQYIKNKELYLYKQAFSL